MMHVLRMTISVEIKVEIIRTLTTFSVSEIGRSMLFRGQALSMLVTMLSDASESVVKYALSMIHELLLHMSGATVAPIRIAGTVPILTRLLETEQSGKFHAIVLNCLVILCGNDEPSKLIFVTIIQYSFLPGETLQNILFK